MFNAKISQWSAMKNRSMKALSLHRRLKGTHWKFEFYGGENGGRKIRESESFTEGVPKIGYSQKITGHWRRNHQDR